MSKFDKPTKLSKFDVAFPVSVKHLMPLESEIPREFNQNNNPYVKFQSLWFFSGLKKEQIPAAKPGIIREDALNHLAAIQGSYEPQHEHKKAAVAYLASLWLETPNV